MPQTKKIELRLSLFQFNTMHEQACVRKIEIKVDRHSLFDITMDARKMLSLLRDTLYTARPWDKGLYEPQHHLIEAVDAAIANAPRKNSKLIEIDKKIVLYLLMDHSTLICKLEEQGYEFDG